MSHYREAERKDLRARLLSGASLLMLAPRRLGKTWLLHKVAEDMSAEGWRCILVDVEGRRTEEDFLHELCASIEKKQGLGARLLHHVSQRFHQFTKDARGGNLQEIIGTVDPRSFLETLVESLNGEPGKTLILIDEIALFVLERVRQDPESTRALLYHLRKLQQTYKNVQWLLTGSVGLDVVARRHGMGGALLDYDSFNLEPFSNEAARSYVEDLCDKKLVSAPFAFGDGAFSQLVQELGWLSPYFLRQIALLVKPSGAIADGSELPTAAAQDIELAASELLSPQRRTHFAAWTEHIGKNFEPSETQLLRAILDIACEANDGEIETTFLTRLEQDGRRTARSELKDALNNLNSDGYLVKRGERWVFQSALLRRYWLEYGGR